MLAAVIVLAASGLAMAASARAQDRSYNLMVTGVPQGVHAIWLTVTNHDPVCVSVTPGTSTNIGWAVQEGHTMSAGWQSAMPCGSETALQHRSYARVTASSNTNFWFDLTRTQVD
jgi:hypothetical protein